MENKLAISPLWLNNGLSGAEWEMLIMLALQADDEGLTPRMKQIDIGKLTSRSHGVSQSTLAGLVKKQVLEVHDKGNTRAGEGRIYKVLL